MEFIETEEFAVRVGRILTDEQIFELENRLIANPETGALIPGTGGARKIRVGSLGKGKSGGARVIYYFRWEHTVFLISIYSKQEQSDLTFTQKNWVAETIRTFKKVKP